MPTSKKENKMNIYAKGRSIEIEAQHTKKVDGKPVITVLVGIDGEHVVTYPNNPKMYITTSIKARELWKNAK